MNKFFTLRRALLAPAMLFLCSIFLQSCTEEMPILKPSDVSATPSGSGTVSSKSVINLTIGNKASTITNPGSNKILFTIISGGTTMPLFRQYYIGGDNGDQTNHIVYTLTFNSDTVGNKKYIYNGSQLIYNKKTYTSVFSIGKSTLNIDKLDETTYTTSGNFSYYVYDDILNPKDSIYLTGNFNIMK